MEKLFIQKLIGALFTLAMVVSGLAFKWVGYGKAHYVLYVIAMFGVYLVFTNKEVLDI